MGYYTDYSLTFKGNKEQISNLKRELLEASRNDDCMKELLESGYVSDAKLYNISEWINELAEKYPDVLIVLSGDGEEPDDIWESRWKGKSFETHNVEMPPFTNPELIY